VETGCDGGQGLPRAVAPSGWMEFICRDIYVPVYYMQYYRYFFWVHGIFLNFRAVVIDFLKLNSCSG
jgi:hypothetical protein